MMTATFCSLASNNVPDKLSAVIGIACVSGYDIAAIAIWLVSTC